MPDPQQQDAATERLAAALADRYRVLRQLGAGGMATVYLAQDLKHDRQVALKVLKPELSAVVGAERFLVEIKTTANLQHPHILPLFDSGAVDGTVFYVMPYVEGESLRERITREQQLPVDAALRIATEVASALDYAHRHGVIHRDIKPENILLHDGRAMVADFGIALAASNTGGGRLTETGMSLGTPHYMSPEQALGERTLDARADVYALGCVLHEMLTGEPPFTGPTAQAVLARVLGNEPESVTALRRTVPTHVAEAILVALAKLPADRFATAAEFAQALSGASADIPHGTARVGSATAGRRPVATLLAARFAWPGIAIAAATAAAWGWWRPVPEPVPSRLSVLTPTIGPAAAFADRMLSLSPDGRTLIYVDGGTGNERIVRRRLDDDEATVLDRVPASFASPMFAPNGREFFAVSRLNGQMFRFPIDGGTPSPLPREAAWSLIAAWEEDGTLWLTPYVDLSQGLTRISTDGQVSYPLGPESAEYSLIQVLPGNRYGLAVRSRIGTSFGPAAVMDLKTGATEKILTQDVVQLHYTSGFIVYVLPSGAMEAVRFNPRTRQVSGAPVELATDVSLTTVGTAHVDVSATGTVAYLPEAPRNLVFVDRSGATRLATPEARNFHIPRFSPDGRELLTDFTTPDGRDVWKLGVADGTLSRITFDRDGHDATWSPDGRRIAYISARRSGGTLSLYETTPLRTSDVDSLNSSPQISYTGQWLPDGRSLVTAGSGLREGSRGDIGILRDRGRAPIEPIVATRYQESFPAVSPDGRWLAYVSDQTGSFEVYLRPLGREGNELRVSVAGGGEPVWAPSGRELFYRAPRGVGVDLVAASLVFLPEPAVTERRVLFDASRMLSSTPHANYDISPDGKMFAMVQLNQSSRIVIIQNLPQLVAEIERSRTLR